MRGTTGLQTSSRRSYDRPGHTYLGHRGMHSFEMAYEDFFVPDDCLIGGEAGQGKGFYFTMRGVSWVAACKLRHAPVA